MYPSISSPSLLPRRRPVYIYIHVKIPRRSLPDNGTFETSRNSESSDRSLCNCGDRNLIKFSRFPNRTNSAEIPSRDRNHIALSQSPRDQRPSIQPCNSCYFLCTLTEIKPHDRTAHICISSASGDLPRLLGHPVQKGAWADEASAGWNQ